MSVEAPRYWQYETSGVLRPAVEAYLLGRPMTGDHIAALRAYFRQWIGSGVWDLNPHINREGVAWLTRMRADVDGLTCRAAISRWLDAANEEGIDPL